MIQRKDIVKGCYINKSHSYKIIDSHVHIGKWGRQLVNGKEIEPFRGREFDSFQKIKCYLDKNSIDRAIIVPMYLPEPAQAFKINKTIISYAQQSKGRLVPGFWVDPSPNLRRFLKESLKLANDWNIKVLKTSPNVWSSGFSPNPDTWNQSFLEGIEEILNFAKKQQAIIQIHTGSGKSDIRVIERLIRFGGPQITFHLVHMGKNAGGHFYFIPRFSEWVAEGLNIYCDTSWASGFAVRWIIREAMRDEKIASRVLFASDEPWGIFKSELSKIIDAEEGTPEIINKFLWENAYKLYPGWEVSR